jgi:sigma-B regulation protein RsbU (phosphoserine phosphatase)
MPGVELAFRYQPAMWVGGDYCDVWPLDDRRLAFAVGDVCGKGLPAAIIMANMQAALRTATVFCDGPAEAVGHVNHHLRQYIPSCMFATLFLGYLDTQNGALDYVNAGHIPPLMVCPGRHVTEMAEPADPVLGVVENAFSVQRVQVERNSGLLLVTDGVTEAMSPIGELLGSQRLISLLERSKVDSAEQMVRLATEAAVRFRRSAVPHDDVTALGLIWRGHQERQHAAVADYQTISDLC